jgi:hypothetical protein
MKIELNHEEITQAAVEFISNQGIDLTNAEVDVKFIAGRGDNGHSAVVDIIKKSIKAVVVEVAAPVAVIAQPEPVVEVTEEAVSEETEEVASEEETPKKSLFGGA